jgi:hypothetical protein
VKRGPGAAGFGMASFPLRPATKGFRYMKKTYIVPVKVEVIVMPVIYVEVIAANATDARNQVKQIKNKIVKTHKTEILDEFAECVKEDEVLVHKVSEVCKAERANLYHTEQECGLCAKADGLRMGLRSIDLAEHIRTRFKGCTTLRALEIANQKD